MCQVKTYLRIHCSDTHNSINSQFIQTQLSYYSPLNPLSSYTQSIPIVEYGVFTSLRFLLVCLVESCRHPLLKTGQTGGQWCIFKKGFESNNM